MTGRVAGKVAFITGAARGQGRSHAIRLAEEGADIIAVDICEDVASVGYGLATEADLAETVKAVEALDRRIFARKADVRDAQALKAVLDAGVAELGKLDIVSANAGIEDRLERLRVAHVGFPGEDPSVECLDRRDRLGQVGLGGQAVADARDVLADVDRDDVGALLGQPDRVTAALTPRGPGDEGDLACYPSSHGDSSLAVAVPANYGTG